MDLENDVKTVIAKRIVAERMVIKWLRDGEIDDKDDFKKFYEAFGVINSACQRIAETYGTLFLYGALRGYWSLLAGELFSRTLLKDSKILHVIDNVQEKLRERDKEDEAIHPGVIATLVGAVVTLAKNKNTDIENVGVAGIMTTEELQNEVLGACDCPACQSKRKHAN